MNSNCCVIKINVIGHEIIDVRCILNQTVGRVNSMLANRYGKILYLTADNVVQSSLVEIGYINHLELSVVSYEQALALKSVPFCDLCLKHHPFVAQCNF
jgi:hypothetical protein